MAKVIKFDGQQHSFPDDFTDADIAAALGDAPKEQAPVTASGLYKAADAGVGKAVSAVGGFLGDASNLGAKGLETATNFVTDKLGMERYQPDRSKSVLNNIPTSETVGKAVQEQFYGGAEPYKPQNTAEKVAQTTGEFIPGIIGGGGLLAAGRRAITNVAAPAAGSEAAGQYTEGTAAEPYARVGGAVVGGMAPSALARAITPLPNTAVRQGLVNALNQEGVTSLTAGQRTGNKALQYAESALGDSFGGGQGAARIQQEGQRQFTEAATRRAGIQGDAGPENLLANHTRIGQEFRGLSARNTLQFDPQFGQDAAAAVRNYQRVPPSQQRAIVENYVQDIVDHMRTGQMPGTYYQEMRSRLSTQANSLRQSDPTLSQTLRGLRNALDNAMERSIPRGSPDAGAWGAARQQYGAQRVLEKSASRAGEATGEGNIVPANLRNAIVPGDGGQYARGQGEFAELARAGSTVMAPLPNSGTSQRNMINMAMALLGGGAGAVGGSAVGAALGAVAAPAVAGRALMSRPVQGYLGNQVAAPVIENLTPQQSALVAALMAAEQQRLQQAGQR
jgi:hypothetical protein